MEIQSDLRQLLDFAGLAYTTKLNEVTEIEISLEDFSVMKPLKPFTNLIQLSLSNTKIENITGLQGCKALEVLLLSENFISKIEGLENLIVLKKLNLSSNKIKNLEGLENLTALETFWVNENQITVIENVSCLKALSEFSICGNWIQEIGDEIEELVSLENLNLSGNPISSFQEIFKLSRLETLRRLSLCDPNYSESTICTWTNYQVFILYFLPQLTQLDCSNITAESRQLAQSTYNKKKLYYTMKKKTLKRSILVLIDKITAEAKKNQEKTWDLILPLLTQAKIIEREIDERVYVGLPSSFFLYGKEKSQLNPSSSISSDALEIYHSSLINKIKTDYQKICGYNRLLHCIISKISNWGDLAMRSFDYEFEGGGNLRFEEGNPSLSWYKSCSDLVTSRYTHEMEVSVTRVLRIHNRLLRNRFEERLENLTNVNENYYKRNIDYLFYGGEDLDEVISAGFRPTGEGCIPLSYSLETAEIQRIRNLCEDYDDVHEVYWPKGRVLLCKVYFGKGKGDLRVPYYQENMTPKEIWELCPFNPPSICWAVYRTFEYDIKQRVWFIFDNTLILPEYLIEFEYSSSSFTVGNFQVEPGFESLARPINAFLSENCFEDPKENLDFSIPGRALVNPLDPENIKLLQIGETQEYLNLLQCDIGNLDWIDFRMRLTILILPCNRLTSLKAVQELRILEKLDVSFNQITGFSGLEYLEMLIELDAHNNCISNLAELKKVPSSVVKLTCFHNEISWDQRYDEVALSLLKNLVLLDWRNISKNAKREFFLEINRNSLKLGKTMPMYRSGYPDSLEHLLSIDLENVNLLQIQGLAHCKLLKRLNLSCNVLEKIENLSSCEFLEDLNLSYNYIEFISGLESNVKLSTLDLSYNRLSSLTGISHLEAIFHLSLEHNQISSLTPLLEFQLLSELYLSDNTISDLKEVLDLKKLPNLLVLDVSGNLCMEVLKAKLFILFNLMNLKVLNSSTVDPSDITQAFQELTGVITEELLFKRCAGIKTTELRQLDLSNIKLKSADGMFTAETFPKLLELNMSYNLFATLGIFTYLPMLAKLDMSNNKIDSFLYAGKGLLSLPNLEILYLSNNIIASFSGVQMSNLKNLRILNISHNLIGKIDLIEHLQCLRELDISYNKIRNIEKKFEVSNIRSLNFDNNGLKHLNFLENLVWIQAIKASNNRISDLSDIEKIQTLPNLLELSLTSNPIDKRLGYRNGLIKKFPNLLFLDGKEVTQEEKGELQEVKKVLPTTGVGRLAVKIASITLDAYFLKIHPRTAGSYRH